MEISFEDITKKLDPYQLFLDSLKSPDTYRKYKNALNHFLELLPTKIYTEVLDSSPPNKDSSTLSAFFVKLAKANPDIANRIMRNELHDTPARQSRKWGIVYKHFGEISCCIVNLRKAKTMEEPC